MISILEPAATEGSASIYRLKVVLLGSEPPVWRRIQVPGMASLDWLHAVLQVAVGWTNSHLHQFNAGGSYYSDTRHNFAEFEEDPEVFEARDFTLRQIAPREQDTLVYEYDFGDSWNHSVLVEKILPPDAAAARTALCLDGARACPPEDCGGIWGYENLLRALQDRKHPDHKHLKEWLGRDFDAETFDQPKTNFWLQNLKWPHVTEAQLRKILMGRDDYHK
jgi:hypothetical protein